MTKISWTDESWNPVTGCTKIAPGCKNCYAESIAKRFWKGRPFSDVQCHEDRLDIPLHWRKPRKIFVCSMSDLFHPKVPFEFIEKVIGVIEQCPQHDFQILTKRPLRMLEYFNGLGKRFELSCCQNLWLGTSISTQADADKNIPILLQIPAAVRFVSLEPMLERIDVTNKGLNNAYSFPTAIDEHTGMGIEWTDPGDRYISLDWVIVGCESGPKQRPCKLEWIRDVVVQCKAMNVPVFVKQVPINGKCSKKPEEWPEDLRIQEYPK